MLCFIYSWIQFAIILFRIFLSILHRDIVMQLVYSGAFIWVQQQENWRRQWHPTPILLPGKSHGSRSLVGCSPWGHEESDMPERLHFHFSLSCFGEGNGNPLQCSCLENPRDGGAWWAAVYGVAQSRTQLKRLSCNEKTLASNFCLQQHFYLEVYFFSYQYCLSALWLPCTLHILLFFYLQTICTFYFQLIFVSYNIKYDSFRQYVIG